jgi:hypothetical protein
MSPRAGFLGLAALVLAATTRIAAADDKADCSTLEISASNAKDPAMDADLKPLEKKLKKPPFSSWNVFKKLSNSTVTLTRNKAETLKLKQGGASLLLRERTDKRLELAVTMDGADGKRQLDTKPSLTAGDWLLLVGTNAKDEGHILALTCK